MNCALIRSKNSPEMVAYYTPYPIDILVLETPFYVDMMLTFF